MRRVPRQPVIHKTEEPLHIIQVATGGRREGHSREDELVSHAWRQVVGRLVVLGGAVLQAVQAVQPCMRGVPSGGGPRVWRASRKRGAAGQPHPRILLLLACLLSGGRASKQRHCHGVYRPQRTLSSVLRAHQKGVTVSRFTARSARVSSSAGDGGAAATEAARTVRPTTALKRFPHLSSKPPSQIFQSLHHRQRRFYHAPRSECAASCCSISLSAAALNSLLAKAAAKSPARPCRSACVVRSTIHSAALPPSLSPSSAGHCVWK